MKVIESLMAEQVADAGTVAMRIKTGQTKQHLDVVSRINIFAATCKEIAYYH